MNAEFFKALELLEKEKGIPKEYMKEKIETALLTAVKKQDELSTVENVKVIIDDVKETVKVVRIMTVVETVQIVGEEIALEDALQINKRLQLGDKCEVEIKTNAMGRLSAQNAKQVIIQGIREAEHEMMHKEYSSKQHEIFTGVVRRIDPRNGIVSVEIGKLEGILLPNEQIKGEVYREGMRIKVYVAEVKSNSRGITIILSRTHPGLVCRLFEIEIPEIYDGTVEIKSISREAGSRTKIAVASKDANVDAIGSCIGTKRARINNILDELGGEKIDIIKYSEIPEEFVAAAISPADVISVIFVEDKSYKVIVPDDQLSLAIGKEGQNARLAARITGFKIDIKPLSKANE